MVYKVIILIVILPNKMKIIKQISWWRISQSEIRKIAAPKKEAAKARGEGERNRLWWDILNFARNFFERN